VVRPVDDGLAISGVGAVVDIEAAESTQAFDHFNKCFLVERSKVLAGVSSHGCSPVDGSNANVACLNLDNKDLRVVSVLLATNSVECSDSVLFGIGHKPHRSFKELAPYLVQMKRWRSPARTA
jgi:hypothetical protein